MPLRRGLKMRMVTNERSAEFISRVSQTLKATRGMNSGLRSVPARVFQKAKLFYSALLLGVFLCVSAGMPAFAGVIVTQNTSVTNWSTGALIMTISDPPGITATVAARAAQTFTAPTNIVLTNIELFVSGTAQTFNLHLFDLGTGYAANSGLPSPYTPGSDLFSGIQMAFTASTGSGFVINLAFTGADQVTLGSGHKYALELEQVSGGPMTWGISSGVDD